MTVTGNDSIQKIGIVGPCAAGKSTLINRLRSRYDIDLRHIAQEHSYVQTMWQRINPPARLIFLDVSYAVTLQRRNLNWTVEEYQEQQRRLAHARQNANFYLMTDDLTPEQVVEKVSAYL